MGQQRDGVTGGEGVTQEPAEKEMQLQFKKDTVASQKPRKE